MHRTVIANSSIIIAFSIIEKMEILKELYQEIIIAEEVKNELLKGINKSGADFLRYKWIKVKKVKEPKLKEYLSYNLDIGEAETIALAEELNADLVLLDDYLGRKFALLRNLKITGTIGILIKAKQKGLINQVKPLIDKLILNNFHIDDELYYYSLKIVNEI